MPRHTIWLGRGGMLGGRGGTDRVSAAFGFPYSVRAAADASLGPYFFPINLRVAGPMKSPLTADRAQINLRVAGPLSVVNVPDVAPPTGQCPIDLRTAGPMLVDMVL